MRRAMGSADTMNPFSCADHSRTFHCVSGRRRSVFESALICLCIILFSLQFVAADIGRDVHIRVHPRERFTILWYFEFAGGGILDMNATLLDWDGSNKANNSWQLMLCTKHQVDPLRDVKLGDACSSVPFDSGCTWHTVLGNGFKLEDRIHVRPSHRTWFYLLQLNCYEDDYLLRLDYVAVNPGGEYLSLSEVPYKTLYVLLPIAWSVLAVGWMLNWIPYRRFNVKLQALMTFVPVSKVVASVVILYYWRRKSVTGVEPTQLAWVSFSLLAVARAVFYLVLMFAAAGWSITRQSFSRAEIQRVWLLVLGLSTAFYAYSWFGGFILFFVVMLYILVLRFIFAQIVGHCALFEHQINIIRNHNLNPIGAPVVEKLYMYRKFQSVMMAYIAVDFMFFLWSSVFLREEPWMSDAMDNSITGLACFAIAYLFRMRPFNPHYHVFTEGYRAGPVVAVENALQAPLIEADQAMAVARAPASPADAAMSPLWHPGMPLPDFELEEPFRQKPRPIVLIYHPATIHHPTHDTPDLAIARPLTANATLPKALVRQLLNKRKRAQSPAALQSDGAREPVDVAVRSQPPSPSQIHSRTAYAPLAADYDNSDDEDQTTSESPPRSFATRVSSVLSRLRPAGARPSASRSTDEEFGIPLQTRPMSSNRYAEDEKHDQGE